MLVKDQSYQRTVSRVVKGMVMYVVVPKRLVRFLSGSSASRALATPHAADAGPFAQRCSPRTPRTPSLDESCELTPLVQEDFDIVLHERFVQIQQG